MSNADSIRTHVVITSVGADRPGIVADLSGWILRCGGNIEDSRMSQLGGEFASLVLVSGPSDLAARLEESRSGFEADHGLTVFARPVAAAPAPPAQPHLRYTLRVTSLDHPGVVHQVADLLRAHGVNIVSATTRTSPAPFTGAAVFHIEVVADVPAATPVTRLRAALDELAVRENMDVTLAASTGA